jgi:hypothetical protein
MTFEEFQKAVAAKLEEGGFPQKTIHVVIAAWSGARELAVIAPVDGAKAVYLGFATAVVQMPPGSTVIDMDEQGAEAAAAEILRRFKG